MQTECLTLYYFVGIGTIGNLTKMLYRFLFLNVFYYQIAAAAAVVARQLPYVKI